MTPNERRLAIHYFDSRGKSMLTREYEAQRICELEAENRRLKALLKQTVSALKSERAKSEKEAIAN